MAHQKRTSQGLGKNIKVFTAHIDLSYRRPLPVNSEYLVDVCVDKVERQKTPSRWWIFACFSMRG
jgi:hypothetical protein